jgi:AMME syndrome candidate gene 1 protein
VASEQGWNQEETLKNLVQKAGYYGKWEDVKNTIDLTTYESSKAHMTYEEYIK